MYAIEADRREALTIAGAYMKEVQHQIEKQLREQIMPSVELSIREAAEKALEEIKPSFYKYWDYQGIPKFVASLTLSIDERIK